MTHSTADPFPPPRLERWRELVARDLRGAPFERLVTRTLDGVEVQPLYTDADVPAGDAGGLPGGAPFTRGSSPLGNAPRAWGIVAEVACADLDAGAATVRDELAGGASGLILRLREEEGSGGLPVTTLADLERLLEGAPLGEVELFLDAGGAFAPAAGLLCALWSRRALAPEATRGGFGADPLGSLARAGRLPQATDEALGSLGALMAWTERSLPWVTAAQVATHPYHDAGASRPQELGFALAAGLEYLRAGRAAGLDLPAAARQVTFSVSVDAELFAEIAKLRALRRLWARVLEAAGEGPPPRSATVHAKSAARMLTVRDPWVNVLRATAAGFAAAVGGAARITLTPFDALAREPSPAARRLARNTHTILQLESHLHRVVDPAGGAYAIEAHTEALAREAWAVLRAVEREGGLGAALASGWVQERVAETAVRRERDVAQRKQAIVGVSEFPLLDEPPLPAIGAAAGAARRLPQASPPAAPAPAAGGASLWDAAAPQDALRAALAGGVLEPRHAAVEVAPLPVRRLAAPFEALRARSDAALARRGARPRVFLASLGPLAEHTARTVWVTHLLAAGGVEAVAPEGEGYADAASAAAAFGASGCREAIVCSSDPRYGELLPSVAPALREAGAARITVAGAPGEREAADRSAGVDGWVHLGQDVVAFLADLLDRLEVSA